jgi:trimeric autotransporter adhesin
MKKNTFFLMILIIFFIKINAQQNVGIGTASPNASSLLEIKSSNRGLLIPRINLVSETDEVTIANPATSLLLYNTNALLPDGEGYYFWNATRWSKFATRSNLANLAWGTAGNAATNPANDFIGTTDNKPLVFKTNNILSGKIDPGPNNVFFGQSAGAAITSGVNNTFIGHIAGAADSSGSDNLFAGHFAGNANTSGSENVFLGQDAGKNNTNGNRNTFVGEDAGIENTTGDENVFMGNGAGRNNTVGNYNTALGSSALNSNTLGSKNAAFGHNALFSNTSGDGNIAFGHSALFSNTGGGKNAAFGDSALFSNTTGNFNSAVGYAALHENISGSQNTAVGYNALFSNTIGTLNSAFGTGALKNNTTGYQNSAFGNSALPKNTSGVNNSAFGFSALEENTTGFNNVAFGDHSLSYNLAGNNNTAIGFVSGPYQGGILLSLDNTTCIGANSYVITSNTMVFGGFEVNRFAFGIPTTNANHALEVGEIVGDGNGAYLTQGGTWTNASDANKKEGFTVLNGNDLLQKISSLPITKWRYKGSDEYHIGPMAQDFYKLFGLGTDDKGISTVDPAGISLAAIQELIKENETLKIQLQQIKQAIDELKIKR